MRIDIRERSCKHTIVYVVVVLHPSSEYIYIYSILPITRTSKGPIKMVRVNECSSYPG